MIAPLCLGGPLAGTHQEDYGPNGIVGFTVIYPGRRIFDVGRYELRWTGIGGPVLAWREYPMSLDEASIIAEGWGER